jgi:nucleotide-binding universal stress UspA family protein
VKIKPTVKPGAVVLELDRGEEKFLSSEPPPLFAIKTVLVPTDFSECSRKALSYAVPLAQQFGAKIVLVHIAHFHYAGSEIDDLELAQFEKRIVADYQQRLEKMGAEQEAPDLRFETIAWVGKVVPGIISAAKATKADLIVISTHGGACAGKLDLGSTTERVVRHAPCPVLVVREREHEFLANQAVDI